MKLDVYKRQGLFYIAKVPAEAVLIQLFAGTGIPEAAGIRRDLVRQNDIALKAAKLLSLIHIYPASFPAPPHRLLHNPVR